MISYYLVDSITALCFPFLFFSFLGFFGGGGGVVLQKVSQSQTTTSSGEIKA